MSRELPPPSAKLPTMADVARAARVSRATVSFVLNNRDEKITPQTKARVRAAATALGYRPNLTAVNLQAQRTSTIGYVSFEEAADPFAGEIIAGALDSAWRHSNALLGVSTGRDSRRLSIAMQDLVDRRIDALLLGAIGTRKVVVPHSRHPVPTILVNCFTQHDTLPCVLPDDRAGGFAAAKVLLDAGHRHLAFLAGDRGGWAKRTRLDGFRQALSAAGLSPRQQVLRYGNYRIDSGYELVRQLLADGHRPTGLICGNDRMALGAYLALAEAGISVPDEISIVGYDDQRGLADDVHPGLTTIKLPYFEMGRWAAEQLLADAVDRLPARTYLPCTVVERDSVAAPREVRPRS